MFVAAILLSVIAQAPAQPECGSAKTAGPDFMAMIGLPSGTLRDRMGGTIVDPPAPRTSETAHGTMHSAHMPSRTEASEPASVDPAPTVEEAAQNARNEAAGICNAFKRPA